MSKAALVGYGLTKFGVREASWRDLASEAGKACFENSSGVRPRDIDAVLVATADEEPYLAAVAAENLGIRPKIATKIENLCSSGGTAITIASGLIQAGIVKTALVLGVEKMTHKKMVPLLSWDFTRGGILIPATWGAVYAQKHMGKFGTTEEQLALVSVKNHRNSSMNPYAHFQKPVSLEDVMASKPIVSPLKLFDCSAKSDGAAAVIVTSEGKARDYTDTPVWILGSGESSHGATFGNINPDYVTWPAVVSAARDAYRSSKIRPKDVDVAELHDAFTI
ncbi:MAG: thiolase family protein, partial [Thaumarchaeota archaeon]|nr:thiolase family protein [Nitrososphaerota archaeon]